MAQLGSHPKVKGQTLLGPDRFPPTVILETEQKNACGASAGAASVHLLCFQAAPPEARVGAGAGCAQPSLKAAPEVNRVWEVPRLLFHSLSPWRDVHVAFCLSLHPHICR